MKPIIVVYGAAGIGKTSFGDDAPDRLFLAVERGAAMVGGPRIPEDGYCQSWQEFISALRQVSELKKKPGWLVVDTISAAEHMLAEEICAKEFNGVWLSQAGEAGFNAFARGSKRVAQEFRQILPLLEAINGAGTGIVLLSHDGLHRASNALGADFQKLAPALDRASWSVIEQFVDICGYAGTDVRASVRSGESKAKASFVGDTRWLYFGQHPARVSKCRAGFTLPDKMLLDWQAFATELGKDPVEAMATEVMALLESATDADKEKLAAKMDNDIRPETLQSLGKRKLEQLVGWLKRHDTGE